MKFKKIIARLCVILICPIGFVEETAKFLRNMFRYSWKNYKVRMLNYHNRIKEYWE